MSKGQARNMQRISAKVTFGTAPKLETAHQPPTIQQLRSLEIARLARFRYAFEIEQRLEQAQRRGESVGLLREKLQSVRNGSMPVPPGYGERMGGPTLAAKEVHVRAGADARSAIPTKGIYTPTKDSTRKLYRSIREVSVDLADLSKGKLSITGAGTVRGLLERFDQAFVEETLCCPNGFIQRVMTNPMYKLAPSISADDGLLLADALAAKMK